MISEVITIRLTGRQFEMISGVISVFGVWPFENKNATRFVSDFARDIADKLWGKVWSIMEQMWTQEGLWPGRAPWTQDLISKRAMTTAEICFDKLELETIEFCLRACAIEFSHDWKEFEIVGVNEMFKLTANDLVDCADFLLKIRTKSF